MRPAERVLCSAVGLCLARAAIVVLNAVHDGTAYFRVSLRKAAALDLMFGSGKGLHDRCSELVLDRLSRNKAPAGRVVLGRSLHLPTAVVVPAPRFVFFAKG